MRRHAFVIPFILVASVALARQQPAASGPAVERARQVVDLLLQEKYADVVAMFTDQIRPNLPVEKLQTGLQPILQSAGAVRRRLDPQTQTVNDLEVVVLPIVFQHSAWEFIVSVNKAGQIAGLFARPSSASDTPWNPAPYAKVGAFRAEEVTIGKGEWQLPGTLTVPNFAGKPAAIVLVHGSGPNDRDESIGPQKPFRDLAEGLSSRGITVLRYEKRTRYAAARLGTLKTFTVQEETVDDVLAAVEFLRTRPVVDPRRIFVLGHSLGGYLIPRIGRRDEKIAGLIALAGAARPFEDMLVDQYTYLASLAGNPPAALEQIERVRTQVARVKTLKEGDKASPGDLPLDIPVSYWLDLKGYDPAREAGSLKQPMLVLQGERDYQVTMTDFGLWKDALKDRANVKFRSFPALNHLFLAGEGKSSPAEYSKAPGHVAPEVIEEIAAWIGAVK